jgi:glycosyltransferase involved in cell wall biosynthesis
MLKFLHHRATVIIANSQATAAQLTKKANIEPARIRVIHNAVDFDRFAPNTAFRQQARELLKAEEDDIVIGFAGRLCSIKGPDLLIKAMAMLLEKSPKYLLVLIGHGPERQNLQTLADSLGISERIRFLGFCNNVNEIINAFDIAVVPSREEPFGIVVLEFMRTRVPLVSSGVHGMAELVENEATALVTAENTPDEISRCIDRLANDPDLRKSLTDKAYDFCERFSVSNNVKAIQQIYYQMV